MEAGIIKCRSRKEHTPGEALAQGVRTGTGWEVFEMVHSAMGWPITSILYRRGWC